MANVTIRTLRYYDREGLLTPSARTESGHRQYTNADLARLQQILALKFLGFSLEEIRRCLRIGPASLRDSLGLQKAMLEEKRAQLDRILQALAYAEMVLQKDCENWQSIVELIRMFQMNQDLSHKYYNEEQRAKIAEWGKNWGAEDQKVASQRWGNAIAELQRLVAENEDPGGPAAQTLAREWYDLVQSFTHGDKGIEQGLANMYRDISTMPVEQRPYPMPFDQAGGKFMNKMLEIYKEREGLA